MGDVADTLQRSWDAFSDAAEAFFSDLASVSWGLLLAALAVNALYVSLRSRAWWHTLRAAFPGQDVPWPRTWAAYITGMGLNGVLPARAGVIARLVLTRRSIERSSYPAIGSSFLVEVIFDVAIGIAVICFALTQGVFPDPPELPDLPAFDLSILAAHPWLIAVLAALTAGAVALVAARVRAFWAQVGDGLRILRDPRRYLRQVVALQTLAYALRFASFWLMLEAFGLEGSARAVLLAMAVFSISSLVPFTPSGAGAQQALLVIVFAGAASTSEVAAYSVGQQAALAAANAVLAFVALSLVFRTRDWRAILRAGRAEIPAADRPGRGTIPRG